MESIPVAHLGPTAGKKPIPVVGCGTAGIPFGTDDPRRPILDAIEAGYRHLDTSAVYRTEKPLGDAVAEAIRRGLIKTRDELFITSKLWCNDAHGHLVLPALRTTLQNLGMEYVDLYLIHWPVSQKEPGKVEFPVKKEDLIPMDFKAVWKAMEECQDLGLAKSIGVSNCTRKKLDEFLSFARIPPAVNQVELNPLWQQKTLREYCKEKGIHVTAHSPLGSGSSRVMQCAVLEEIAKAKGKTVAQVCLRWIFEQGVSMAVRSSNKERMKQNLQIFGWKLSPEDTEKINGIPQQRGILGFPFISEGGPFKSVKELWDDE